MVLRYNKMSWHYAFNTSMWNSLLYVFYLPNSYVLRRILRRGIRYGSEKLNTKPGMFASLVDTVVLLLVSTSAFQFFRTIHDFVFERISSFLCGDLRK